MRTVAIIQARMGSSRLPGKVLMDLAGATVLDRTLQRVRRASSIDDVWVATTSESQDDALVAHCEAQGWSVTRGSEHDVLDRYHRAAVAAGADVVVRVTSDCPLVDPDVIDEVVASLPGHEYSSNIVPRRTFPRGLDVEALPASVLQRAWQEAQEPAHREHVTPFVWSQPERFSQALVTSDVDASAHRWTVDTPADYELLRRIYDALPGDAFGWREVLGLLENHPDWVALNADIRQKPL